MDKERLLPAERHDPHDLSIAAYLQIAVEIPIDCIIVKNLEEFQCLVSETLNELYPVYARLAHPRNITVDRRFEISHSRQRPFVHPKPRASSPSSASALEPNGSGTPFISASRSAEDDSVSRHQVCRGFRQHQADVCRHFRCRRVCSLGSCLQCPRLATASGLRINGLGRSSATFRICKDKRCSSSTHSNHLSCSGA